MSMLVIYAPIPLLLGKRNDRHGMRGVLQDVVIPRLLSCYHFLRLAANVYHGITKPFASQMWAHSDHGRENSLTDRFPLETQIPLAQ